MNTFELDAELRQDVGKGASRRLRKAGKVPAIMYGGTQDPTQISLGHNDLLRRLEEEAFFSHVLTVNLGGKVEKVVLKDMQRHPAKPQLLHMDLLRVSDNQVLHMHVPVHYINEDTCPGKKAGGLVSHHMVEVEVTCMAKDLPEFIEVDLGEMEMGGVLKLSDLSPPEGVALTALTHGDEHDQPIVTVHMAGKIDLGEEEEGEGEGEGEGEEPAE